VNAITDFKCSGSYSEGIPAEVLEKTGCHFPQAHTDMLALAYLAREMKKLKNETICRLPFCLTIEAEAMGADIKLDDMKNGPRVRKYVFTRIEEIENIPQINFHQGRIKAVLDSVAYLYSHNETVALNIEGPFTILSSLIEPKILYKAIRNKDQSIFRGLEIIEENIVAYALQGIKNGIKILSYADPVGAIDIIGPQIYRQHSGRVTYNVLKKLTDMPHNAVIHLCGKTSNALEKNGFCLSIRQDHEDTITYDEALSHLINDREQTRIIGHSCFRQISWSRRAPKIWEIRLNNPPLTPQ
jgi:MtaA/CmuA family methyltransferase